MKIHRAFDENSIIKPEQLVTNYFKELIEELLKNQVTEQDTATSSTTEDETL